MGRLKKKHLSAEDGYWDLPLRLRKKLNKPLYLVIVHSFTRFLIQKMLDGFTVWLPAKLGKMSIKGKYPKMVYNEDGTMVHNLAINYQETKKQKKKIYHFNEHTDGAIYKFYWERQGFKIKKEHYFIFKPAQSLRQTLNKEIKKGRTYLIVK